MLRLEELKKKLAKEGLFDESRKRPLPRFPRKVGVIAGQGSAGMKDIVFNLSKRWPLTEIIAIPSLVQGKEAPVALLKALEEAKKAKVDTLIIGRGGGSSEDLWAFNDEALARALAAFPVPTISAVGHEVDVTLIDYVADKRVSTPTGAAVAAVPDQNEILQDIDQYQERLSNALKAILDRIQMEVEHLSNRPFFARPESIYQDKMDKLNVQQKRLDLLMATRLEQKEHVLASLKGRLEALSPKQVLSRGYTFTQTKEGKILSKIDEIEEGQEVRTFLKDGIVTSVVTKKEKNNG